MDKKHLTEILKSVIYGSGNNLIRNKAESEIEAKLNGIVM